ncbi:MAG: hypothetical protein AAF985_08350 [Bacteroidota bacterium]
MTRAFSIFPLLLLCFLACQQSPKSSEKSKATTESTAPKQTDGQANNVSSTQYPSVPVDLLKEVWDNCDFVDYTFYELPMSMSFDNKASIQRVLQHISVSPPIIKTSCKPTGRAFFQKKGADLAIIEFYLHQDCNYFVFLENGKATYANQLTKEGFEFYQQSIQQAMGQFKQQTGQ